jgi:hypothetical protein
MSEKADAMLIYILRTGLFEEEKIISDAIDLLAEDHEIEQFDATRPDIEDQDWDDALKKLIRADRVLPV